MNVWFRLLLLKDYYYMTGNHVTKIKNSELFSPFVWFGWGRKGKTIKCKFQGSLMGERKGTS